MLTSQKLAIRTSEIRQRLNTIASLDTADVTDEVRTEADTLRGELDATETQYRAALAVEGREEAEARGAFGNGKRRAGRSAGADWPREHRRLPAPGILEHGAQWGARRARRRLGLSGDRAGRWRGRALGTARNSRADAPRVERRTFTDTGDLDGSIIQRPILQRLFGMGVMGTLGVRIDSVPAGRSEWPLITGGVAPAEFAEGTAATAPVVAVFTSANSQAETAFSGQATNSPTR